jgi:hypothetical protein
MWSSVVIFTPWDDDSLSTLFPTVCGMRAPIGAESARKGSTPTRRRRALTYHHPLRLAQTSRMTDIASMMTSSTISAP